MNHILAALLPVLLALPLTAPIALIDLRRRIIPNALNGALLGLGLGLAAVQGLTTDDPAARDPAGAAGAVGLALAQAALAYGLFAALRAGYGRLRGRTGLGLGDVKFVAAAMPWIGLAQLPLMILVASTSALLAVAALRLTGRRIGADTRLPFGPFLVLGLHGAQLLRPDL
ncbi:prepilin peptidase [Methylobacterium sp. J-078]|uniref:prepilin peptidase n=1 Tax=Methylobacterium sp. J-078 TaxID=2836657 RepID=UPI001FBA2568|nr:prepilin peptidase [Methylobacterium sp. J-078]MCJ2048006.1 prepilin peptidase [Methylobacterium sp. J-078]